VSAEVAEKLALGEYESSSARLTTEACSDAFDTATKQFGTKKPGKPKKGERP
jgi:hypothetical protein